ncbi:MAG TPA: bifunctional phosphoribosylaminoimidazolecarboxamide formyltransferase/IMP cyclohydrolase [Longimicrobiaceae bacterium]|nr:bifunctional phosphoribosylaminoimidazolecarboxamide formyltransferase/IMP cyclohydrolase [Longimicrobiaceae bacterium]
MPRALLSVSDKQGIVPFARALRERGWTLLSTGGTARELREAGLPVLEASEATGHPEMLAGRVKTLHPGIHAGILFRRDLAEHREQLDAHGYEPIDLVAVNLYPFRETVARPDTTRWEAIEQIDIGGPAMLRSAAKGHEHVWVVVDPADYELLLDALDTPLEEALALRRRLAAKAFAHTAAYDSAIADYLAARTDASDSPAAAGDAGAFPAELTLTLRRVRELRYGENPDQAAALYAESDRLHEGLPGMHQLHGKELSFNNLLDIEGALFALSAWDPDEAAACVIIKHTTPCGLAVGADAAEAYARARGTDPTSAFGSVVGFNTEVTEQAAILLRPNFVEVIVAPGFAIRALSLLGERKNLRLIVLPPAPPEPEELDFKRIWGGFAVQQRLRMRFPEESWRVVSARAPSPQEWHDLRFAWRAVASVKSNAVLLARDGMTVGIGAGQMSRVDSSRLAALKAQENGFELEGAVLASDAFFPFRDGVDAAAEAGIRAVIQPGGSVRDPEVIAAADEHGMTMIFTGRRLFRH